MFIGLIIVCLGTIFLLRNLGILSGAMWEIFWPSLIIVFGLAMIFKKKRKSGFWGQEKTKKKET
jgi:hypothetical protein